MPRRVVTFWHQCRRYNIVDLMTAVVKFGIWCRTPEIIWKRCSALKELVLVVRGKPQMVLVIGRDSHADRGLDMSWLQMEYLEYLKRRKASSKCKFWYRLTITLNLLSSQRGSTLDYCMKIKNFWKTAWNSLRSSNTNLNIIKLTRKLMVGRAWMRPAHWLGTVTWDQSLYPETCPRNCATRQTLASSYCW